MSGPDSGDGSPIVGHWKAAGLQRAGSAPTRKNWGCLSSAPYEGDGVDAIHLSST